MISDEIKWLDDLDDMKIHITSKKNRYRYAVFTNGAKCLLFPSWFPPTEKQIFATRDEEIINAYLKVDNFNKVYREEIRYDNEVEIVRF